MTIRASAIKHSVNPELKPSQGLLAICAILFAGASFADTVPDASRILDETKRALPAEKMPNVVAPEQREVTAVDLGPEGILPLKGFTFEGNSALDDAELDKSLQPYIGQDAGIDDLYNLAGMLAQIYAAKGYLATVRILQQDVSDGIVNFTIVEARFGKANIDYTDTESKQIQQGVIESIVARQAKQGELVEYAQVDRAILLANDRVGYDVVGGLVPGDENQETALSLRVAPKQRFSGVLNLDNHGSRATGNERAILSTQFASPTGVGDRLSVNALVTQGVRYAGLSYTRPIGFDGLTYTLDASHTDYRIVEADDAAQKSEGNSTTIGASLRYPLIRSRSQNLFANAGLNRTLLSSEDSTNEESKYKIHSAVFSLYGNFWDQFFNGASTSYHVDVTRGYVDIDKDTLKYTADQAGPETAGNYAKLAMGLQRSETLDAASSLTFSLEGQIASKNLDSAEKLYLGGPNGVRAYPNSEGGGSEGLSASLELERKLNEMISGFVFYDWGRIRQYKFNTAPAADPNLYTLEGVGFGFKGRFANDISWNATLAHRTNNNPNPTTTGDDQDGTKRENRFWMSLSLPF